MSQHSVAETKNQLSELIDRAGKGEEIIITRHGHPVAKISGVKLRSKTLTVGDLDWLAQRRAGRGKPKQDAGTLVSRMRDEEWQR